MASNCPLIFRPYRLVRPCEASSPSDSRNRMSRSRSFDTIRRFHNRCQKWAIGAIGGVAVDSQNRRGYDAAQSGMLNPRDLPCLSSIRTASCWRHGRLQSGLPVAIDRERHLYRCERQCLAGRKRRQGRPGPQVHSTAQSPGAVRPPTARRFLRFVYKGMGRVPGYPTSSETVVLL